VAKFKRVSNGKSSTFIVEGNTLTGDVPEFIQEYAVVLPQMKGVFVQNVEAYTRNFCGSASNLQSLQEGYGIILEQ
jgi:hypothetical protein